MHRLSLPLDGRAIPGELSYFTMDRLIGEGRPRADEPSANRPRPDLSVVVPVFDEEANIKRFVSAVKPWLEAVSPNWDIVFVNDGSRDATLNRIRAEHACDNRVRAIDLSRGFGKEVALSAGLDHADGRAVVLMDVDLQDPPELIADMVARWRDGFDVVLAERVDRSSDSVFKRNAAALFYWLLARMSRIDVPTNVGDFRLLDARVVAALRRYPERERFMKGIFATVGFVSATLTYVRPPRAGGATKFKTRQLLGLALQGIISFSTVPLKIWTYIGGLAAIGAVAYAAIIIIRTLFYGIDVPGYASLLTVVLLFNGLMLVGLGIQGEYIARVFAEVKQRPLYIVREVIGDHAPAGSE